ncbi:MAG TPA: ATP synthase F1 subunit delta [Acidimicrobiales bacterium]|jgi:F-type H+-transporting ATPase subunit delta|nr:ATP synthase F1 subunit delta [Acidimicrobiales bacterium]
MADAPDERIDGYATALFEVARVEGSLDEVEDELFRFGRLVEGNDELRATLTDETVPVERRRAVVAELLGSRASPVTANLVALVVGGGRARQLPEIIDALVRRAAAAHDREVAEVRSAVPLDDDQRSRLAEALRSATGKQVEVKVIVDPSVLGGLVAQVGDTVIDGSVRTKLDQLRETIR